MDGDEVQVAAPDAAASRWTAGRTLALVSALGLHAWLAIDAIPAYQVMRAADLTVPAAAAVLLSPLALVAGGLLLLARSPRAPWLLGLVYPLALLLPALAQPALCRAPVMTELAAGLSALGLAGYLLALCWAQGRAEVAPLATRARPGLDGGRAGRRRLAAALAVTTALVAAVVIAGSHLLPEPPGAEPPDGSRRVVASALGLVLWAGAALLVLAPAAGRPRPAPLPRPSRGAAAIWLVVLAIAATMLLVSDG